MLAMLGVGYYFLKKNNSVDDYYVAGRQMKPWHIGLSVVATDVGGGFSIGLGGLGFTLGLSGSWMLFTGLIGAWLSAVILIPRIFKLPNAQSLLSLPQIFKHFYGKKVALMAALISVIGYVGFTSSQILAGAKLASASFEALDLNVAIWLMGLVAVVYTVAGGLKAVIYTDTVQWIILLVGLIFIGLPICFVQLGGWDAIRASLGADMLSLNQLRWQDMLNWAITIIPIWFVGMTLYQRIFASKGEKEAKKAWFIAGIFEWPIMAFLGVALGMLGRVAFQQNLFAELGFAASGTLDPEMGLPLLLRTLLPVGLLGIMLSAYFSAIMSTADSCLMAASGNALTDLLAPSFKWNDKQQMNLAKWITLVVGIVAWLIATQMRQVLDLMLYSYAFMVSGLLVPLMAAWSKRKAGPVPALSAMLLGGGCTLTLILLEIDTPLDLDPNLFGLSASLISYFLLGAIPKINDLKLA